MIKEGWFNIATLCTDILQTGHNGGTCQIDQFTGTQRADYRLLVWFFKKYSFSPVSSIDSSDFKMPLTFNNPQGFE